MNKEPLVTVSTITAIAAAVIGVLVAFAVPLTEDQQVAILALVGVLAPVVVALVVRPKVTPEAKAQDRERAALRKGQQEAAPVRQVDLDPPAEEI